MCQGVPQAQERPPLTAARGNREGGAGTGLAQGATRECGLLAAQQRPFACMCIHPYTWPIPNLLLIARTTGALWPFSVASAADVSSCVCPCVCVAVRAGWWASWACGAKGQGGREGKREVVWLAARLRGVCVSQVAQTVPISGDITRYLMQTANACDAKPVGTLFMARTCSRGAAT